MFGDTIALRWALHYGPLPKMKNRREVGEEGKVEGVGGGEEGKVEGVQWEVEKKAK